MVYLPISIGYRNCYQQYMSRLGYNVSTKPNGAIVVEEVGDDEDNHNEYVSFTTYCRKWKKDYPQLKVSRPVEDICQYCYVFAHRHRYLANHSLTDTCIEFDDDGCAWLNPYKMVEMWKNYGPHVPSEHRDNILYQRPPDSVMAVVKMERGERAVFRQRIKEAKASGMREQLDRIAVESDGEEQDGGATVNVGQQ
jgi:hypothetical protein